MNGCNPFLDVGEVVLAFGVLDVPPPAAVARDLWQRAGVLVNEEASRLPATPFLFYKSGSAAWEGVERGCGFVGCATVEWRMTVVSLRVRR